MKVIAPAGWPGLFRPPGLGFFSGQERRSSLEEFTLKVQRKNSGFRVDVTPDGKGLVSQAGTLLLAEIADRTGLTAALSAGLSGMRERRSAHDPGIDETGEAAAAVLRPGNAGANTALDQIQVAEIALGQIPGRDENGPEVLLRADSAGAVHGLLDWARDSKVLFSVGFDLTGTVRDAIGQVPVGDWVPARNQYGKVRENGEVTEITGLVDLTTWPEGSRVIVRRERPHPGAQLTFTDDNGHRFQAILTDQTGPDITLIERNHRARARAENQIADMKDTGLQNLPFRDFEMNQVWLEIVTIAHDLLAWTKTLTLHGELAVARPKRIRNRLLHTAARLSFHSRQARLRLQADWPWAIQLTAAFRRLARLPAPVG